MDYKKTASEILEAMGTKENLISAAHCATRLRLVIKDNAKASKEALEAIDGVKGVFFASGQLQIIIGTGTVNKVFDEFILAAGISESSKEDLKKEAVSKQNLFKRLIKALGDVFVPIIPAIVSAGIIMGLLSAIEAMVSDAALASMQGNAFYIFLKLMSNAAFTFLPVLIGFSACKVFGGNPFLGAVLAMFMIHTDLQNAWTVATEGVKSYASIGSYQIALVGYQGHVIPIIVAAFILSKIEIKLHKIIPDMIDLFVTPLVSLLAAGFITFVAIGPFFTWVENMVLNGVQMLIAIPFGIGGFLMGAIYAPTVVTGIHHMYTVIDMGQLSQYGFTYWLPIASAANVGQAGACFAVALKSKNKKIRSLAFPSGLSALLGITEPAIFGVNLRFFKPFLAGCIGGALGSLYAALIHLGAQGTGVTGIFGFLLHMHAPLQYLILLLISFGTAFFSAVLIGWKEE